MDKKKQKIFIMGGLLAAVVVLGGCGTKKDEVRPVAPFTPAMLQQDEVAAPKESALPATVSAQPGATVDAEISNIDNDLKTLDDASLTQGLSDSELGL